LAIGNSIKEQKQTSYMSDVDVPTVKNKSHHFLSTVAFPFVGNGKKTKFSKAGVN
jgi:hypothetical protein